MQRGGKETHRGAGEEVRRSVLNISLGHLKQVDLRDIWLTEDRGFTPWLAKEENLKILSETIGIELELEAQEKDVGPFRADILCKSTVDDTWVLVENQIEKTDHRHLGQLLTYAAGLDAVSIVWIAAKFSEEHRKAIDWLNEITDAKFRFFGLEVELWRINDSLPAPKFNIISKPNDWGKRVKLAAQELEDSVNTPTRELRVKYWTKMDELFSKSGTRLRVRQKWPNNWQDFPLGRTNSLMRVSISVREGYVVAGVHLTKQMSGLYEELLHRKASIEHTLGFPLEWRDDPYPILNAKLTADISLEDDWDRQMLWVKNVLERMADVFSEHIRNYNPLNA